MMFYRFESMLLSKPRLRQYGEECWANVGTRGMRAPGVLDWYLLVTDIAFRERRNLLFFDVHHLQEGLKKEVGKILE